MTAKLLSDFKRIYKKIHDHMGWEHQKTELWFRTKNPFLGNATPLELMQIGRAHKLEQFVNACIEEAGDAKNILKKKRKSAKSMRK